MARLLQFSVFLSYLPIIESMAQTEGCLSQPSMEIWLKKGQAATLDCDVTSRCASKDLKFEWFLFRANDHCRLNLSGNPNKYMIRKASLEIRSLQANDSGIYHCAAVTRTDPAPDAQHVGSGTTLVVQDKVHLMVRHILLMTSCVLLALYSLAIVALIIIKKYGCNIGICRRMYTSDKKNSNSKTIFRDVVQELRNKKDMTRSRQAVGRDNLSTVEVASNEFSSSADGIYQNVRVAQGF